MARNLDVHPDNPQLRTIAAAVDPVRRDGLIAGDRGDIPTRVVDFTSGEPVIPRYAAGEPAPFE